MSESSIVQIKKDEDTRSKAYLDSKGNLTIGVGFNLTRGDAKESLISAGVHPTDVLEVMKVNGKAITEEQIDGLFQMSLSQAVSDAASIYSNWSTLPVTVRDTLTNMSFQLGRKGLREFKEMNKAVAAEDWGTMQKEMLNSTWAKKDSPARANRLASNISQVKTPKQELTRAVPRALSQQETYKRNLRDSRATEIASFLSREALVTDLAKTIGSIKQPEEEQPKPRVSRLQPGLFEDEKGSKFFVDDKNRMFEIGEDGKKTTVIDPSVFDIED